MNVHVTKTVPIKPKNVLSLGKRILLKLSRNNTSRMTGDSQVRFCERLAGETPACLLSKGGFVQLNFIRNFNIFDSPRFS